MGFNVSGYSMMLIYRICKVFILLLLELFSNLTFSQPATEKLPKKPSELEFVLSLLEKENKTIISESQIELILDSLSATSTTRAPNLSEVDKVGNKKSVYSAGERSFGGIIFWVDSKGQHGLVAADSDQSEGVTWYDGKTYPLKDGILTGRYNTDQILINKSVAFNAAKVCSDYKGGGYNDWYLPSKYELRLLYKNKNIIGGFAKDYYWSSTEENDNVVWLLSFYGGYDSNYLKYGSSLFRVRAIRGF